MEITRGFRIFGSTHPSGRFASRLVGLVTLNEKLFAITTLSFIETLKDGIIYSRSGDGSTCRIGELSTETKQIDAIMKQHSLACFRLSDDVLISDSYDPALSTGKVEVAKRAEVVVDANKSISTQVSNSSASLTTGRGDKLSSFSRLRIIGEIGEEEAVSASLLGARCFQGELLVGIIVAYNSDHRELYAASFDSLHHALLENEVYFATADEILAHNEKANPIQTDTIPFKALDEMQEVAQNFSSGLPNADQRVEALVRAYLSHGSGQWEFNIEQLAIKADHLSLAIDFKTNSLIFSEDSGPTLCSLSDYIKLTSQTLEVER